MVEQPIKINLVCLEVTGCITRGGRGGHLIDMGTTPQSDLVVSEAVSRGQEFFSIAELANRWRCSRGTVYTRLRRTGAQVLDFAPSGKKGRKCVHIDVVLQIEKRQMRRLR